jgi:multidrug efflux pump subunit AcrA (membrane-fusion protein)
MKKVVAGALIIAVIALAGWRAYTRIQTLNQSASAARAAPPVAVEVRPVQKGMIRDIGVFTGSLVPESQFVVAPKAAGWLKQILVDIGDSVQRNQVIAVLDDEGFTRQVEQARAELQVAKANAENSTSDLDLAKREYERVTALRERQIASAAELDTVASAFSASQAKLKVAQAQVAQREAALQSAELQLSYTKVRAFWEEGSANGSSPDNEPNRVIGERFVDEGTLVQMNQPIVSVLVNDPLKAIIFVIERDYPKMSIGQEAVITTDAYPGKTFTGVIRRIAPLLKESSRQARVEIEIANPGHLLKPGMFVRARVEFATHEDATLVPITALVKREGREGVFVVEESQDAGGKSSRAHFIPVTTGIISGETAEVTEPPISGVVVTLGNHLLEDGSAVVVSRAPPAPNAETRAGGAQ